jgi:uncharacterized integral membrane protein
MNLRTLAVTLALALLAAFTALNWGAFTTPTTLSLGFGEVQAPLGLVMLTVCAVLAAVFLAYIALQQAGVILDARRMSRELKAQRELADSAEASRFTELRAYITERLAESERSQSAHLGEIEDKLDRLLPPRAGA